MQQQLGVVSLRLPSSLEELVSSTVFSAAAAAAEEGPPDAAQVAAVLQQARRQPVTELDWALLVRALTKGQLHGSQLAQLVAMLSWAAGNAREQLGAAAAASERPSGGNMVAARAAAAGASDVGNPRLRQALQNTLKLALLFLCSLARGEGMASSDAQHPAAGGGKRGGKKAKGSAGGEATAEVLTQLQARRDALLAVGRLEAALHDSRTLLPSVSDLRAAGRLVRGAAMYCLVHLLPPGAAGGDRTAKECAEGCFQAATGILSQVFVRAAERQGQAAAAETLHDLLGVIAEPKQQAQVLAGAARLVGNVMQQSRRAGAAIVARLTDRIHHAAAAVSKARKVAGAAAQTAHELDACLHFAVLLAGTGNGSALQAALLLRLPKLLPLARSPSSSTRRIVLELCSALLPSTARLPFNTAAAAAQQGACTVAVAAAAPPSPPVDPRQAYQTALLEAVVSRLYDKDATLRAKALGCLEKHASLLAAHLSAVAAAADVGSEVSNGSGGTGDTTSQPFFQGLCGRLRDKSPSVRKKAVALLAGLLQPAAGLSRPASAALSAAVLPLAAQLLGVRPDSALHLGEDTLEVLTQAVLRMAAASSSAAGVPHLLQLAAGASEPAARAQLQAAVLDLLLPPSAGPTPADRSGLLLHNLTNAVKQCSDQQVEQLRQAVQHASGREGSSATPAVACSAVRACYQRLHSLCSGTNAHQQAAEPGAERNRTPVAAEDGTVCGSADGVQAEALHCSATALYVLGPLSGLPQADALASLAEARLLLSSLQYVAQAGISKNGAAASRLLACTALAWQQLGPVCPPADGDSSQPSAEQSAAASAALVLAHGTLPALQALLMDAGCTPSQRQAALQALLALPPAAEAPLRMLNCLTAAAAVAAATDGPGQTSAADEELHEQLQQLPHGNGKQRLGVPSDLTLPSSSPEADSDDTPEAGSSPAISATAAQRASTGRQHPQQQRQHSQQQQRGQLSALVALLDLLGALAPTYEQQKAAFLKELMKGASQPERKQAQQAVGQTSHFGRPLRPASEWWVGAGHPAGGAAEQAGTAAQQGEAAAADDYMQAEHQAAEHEAAAQRCLDSLLDAADTAPACYLPLLERLAGQAVHSHGGGEGRKGVAVLPSSVQAAALRALGRIALLSEPLSQRAVALAEAALGGSGAGSSSDSSGSASTEVQAAAVALLADAIEAYPNRYSDRLLLIGRLMAPSAEPAAADGELPTGPADSRRACAATETEEPASQQREQLGGEQQSQPGAAPATEAQLPPAPAALPPEQREQLARVAAAAYCRLLLRNKLKLQGMLGPLGSALAAGSPRVAALVQHALRQMLVDAPPRERARLCMALFHQTQPASRLALAQVLVDPKRGLLPAAELRGDVLVSQALQALLAAAQSCGSGLSGGIRQVEDSLVAAATLLRAMQPSANVLAALLAQLQAGGFGSSSIGCKLLAKLPAATRQALQAFVSSHVPAAAGREDGEQAADGVATDGGNTGGKRKRAAGRGKGSSAAVQQQLLALLGGDGSGGRSAATCRPPRQAATSATATAGVPAAAKGSSAAPSTSVRRGHQQVRSGRNAATPVKPISSTGRGRCGRTRVLQEGSDSEASS